MFDFAVGSGLNTNSQVHFGSATGLARADALLEKVARKGRTRKTLLDGPGALGGEGFHGLLDSTANIDDQSRKNIFGQEGHAELVASGFISLESWLGRITQLDAEAGTFAAIVESEGAGVIEVAEFSVDELSPDDLDLLEIGAVFYWNIGYAVEPSGRRSTASTVRFRRMLFWTRRELEQADKRASAYAHWLNPAG